MPRNRLLIIGVALSFVAAILVYAVVSRFTDSDSSEARPASKPMGYASKDLPVGHLIVAADLQFLHAIYSLPPGRYDDVVASLSHELARSRNLNLTRLREAPAAFLALFQ